jgi:hypothetical protein
MTSHLQSFSRIPQHIILDSAQRDRTKFPLASTFTVETSDEQSTAGGATTARDPLVDGYPSASGVTAAGMTVLTSVTLDTPATAVQNAFVGAYLQVGADLRKVGSFDRTTKIAVVDTPYPGLAPLGTAWNVRHELPTLRTTAGAGTTATAVVLATAAATLPDNVYANQYVHVVATGELARITEYDAATKTATLVGALGAVPGVGDAVEVLRFTRDNFQPLLLVNSTSTHQGSLLYEVTLMCLSLPNVFLRNRGGGAVNALRHVFVRISNTNTPNSHLQINNRAASRANIAVAIDDDAVSPLYLQLKGASPAIIQYNPHMPLEFAVIGHDGAPLEWMTPDTASPLRPDEHLQILACFRFTPIGPPGGVCGR